MISTALSPHGGAHRRSPESEPPGLFRRSDVSAPPQQARRFAKNPVLRWALFLLLAGYLLFSHGCHGDEDNELFAALRVVCRSAR
jgi:hypothetical protein